MFYHPFFFFVFSKNIFKNPRNFLKYKKANAHNLSVIVSKKESLEDLAVLEKKANAHVLSVGKIKIRFSQIRENKK